MMLLGAVILAGAIADSRLGGWLFPPGAPAAAAALTDIDRIFIRSDSGQVRILAEDRQDVSATVQGRRPGRTEVELVRRGSELQVRISRPWWYWPLFAGDTVLDVRLPASFDQNLALEVRSGSLNLSGPLTLVQLDLELRSGHVTLQQIYADEFRHVGRSGTLSATDVQAGAADLRLASGKAELVRFAGAVRASMSSGHLVVQFAALQGPVLVDQASGKLLMEFPDDAGFLVDASMRSGSLQSDLVLEDASVDGRHSLWGRHGQGTHLVQLRAASGSITLR